MIICPECNSLNKDDDKFCTTCGAPLSDVPKCKEYITCSVCQTKNNAENTFCSACKTPLKNEFSVEVSSDQNDTAVKKRAGRKLGLFSIVIIAAFAIIICIMHVIGGSGEKNDESIVTLSNIDSSQTELLAQELRNELEGKGTVSEWFASASETIQKYQLSDAEAMKLNDLSQRVSKLDVTNYEDQLKFLKSAKALRDEVVATRPLLVSADTASDLSSSQETEPSGKQDSDLYNIEPEWDFSDYPEIKMYIHIKDKTNGQEMKWSSTEGNFNWVTSGGSHWEYSSFGYDYSKALWCFDLLSDKTESADEMLEEWKLDIHVKTDSVSAEASASLIPANEMAKDLLAAYLDAYIYDISTHKLDHLMQYIETNVPEDENFNWTLFYQMRKEINNGFLNTTNMELKDFQVNGVEKYDDQTLHIYSTERYDGTYEEPFSVWKNEGNGIADSIRQLIGDVNDQQEIRLKAYITQTPEYLLRKSADGTWKFYSYTGDLSLTPNWSVYEAREIY